jgi:hypothetical protein
MISRCTECESNSETHPPKSCIIEKSKMDISQFTLCLDGRVRCEECMTAYLARGPLKVRQYITIGI